MSILAAVSVNYSYAAQTNFSSIRQVNHNGEADYTFFLTEGKWQVSQDESCSPTYVQVTNAVKSREKILSIGLAAFMAGKSVQFQGHCSASNSDYFDATYHCGHELSFFHIAKTDLNLRYCV